MVYDNKTAVPSNTMEIADYDTAPRNVEGLTNRQVLDRGVPIPVNADGLTNRQVLDQDNPLLTDPARLGLRGLR